MLVRGASMWNLSRRRMIQNKNEPNEAMEPTPVNDAGPAPSTSAAHLGRQAEENELPTSAIS